MRAFLVYTPDHELGRLGDGVDLIRLGDGLSLARTDRTRSRLYHDVKALLPRDAALLVAPLDGPPKFKGMAAGRTAAVTAWFGRC